MNQILLSVALCTSLSGHALGAPCSIHPSKSTADADLPALAKVTEADAQSTALKAVDINNATIAKGELETEGGCLIYSFDIKTPGAQSIIEITVDAGTGKILSKRRESTKAQATEAASDHAAVTKP